MPALVFAAFILVIIFVGMTLVSQLLFVCEPNEVLVLSGAKWAAETGGKRGYRVCFGGRAWRIPMVERVDRIDMRIMLVEIKVPNAYSEGGIPLEVRAIANVKISSDPQLIGNAIERFLGLHRSAIERVAKETLEGNLRGVIATMTPEAVNNDRLRFEELIQNEVHRDLAKLGLHVDVLKIQHVHDNVDYMDSISRAAIAHVQKEASVAESDAKRAAENVEAQAQASIRIAQQKAETAIKQKQNELAALKSQFDGEINSEIERTEAAGREARAQAERQLQEVRTTLEKLRLEAEVVLPAEAAQEASRLRAAGAAAVVSERGRATADAFRALAEVWATSKKDARDIFLLQKLEGVLKEVVSGVSKVRASNVTLIDNGDGASLPSYVSAYPAIVGSVLDEIKSTLGIDLTEVLRSQSEPELSSDLTAEQLDKIIQAGMAEASSAGGAENVYAKAYYMAIKNRHLSAREKQGLEKLATALKLSNDLRDRIEARVLNHAGSRTAEA